MRKSILIFLFISQFILAEELLVVANKEFLEQNLTREEVSTIFLDKRRFFNKKKILVMNFEVGDALRSCFEKNILKKSKRSLERYWRKAYYQGKRPPKIIKSKQMLFSYLDNVSPSIGYCDLNETTEHNVTVLYSITCK